jgi:hypothetical protein
MRPLSFIVTLAIRRSAEQRVIAAVFSLPHVESNNFHVNLSFVAFLSFLVGISLFFFFSLGFLAPTRLRSLDPSLFFFDSVAEEMAILLFHPISICVNAYFSCGLFAFYFAVPSPSVASSSVALFVETQLVSFSFQLVYRLSIIMLHVK